MTHSFEEGSYRACIRAVNSDAKDGAGANIFTNSDYAYFDVVDPKPEKPELINMSSQYYIGNLVTFDWLIKTSGTRYDIYFYQKEPDGSYIGCGKINNANPLDTYNFEEGSFRATLRATNPNAPNEDGTGYLYTNADHFYFEVVDLTVEVNIVSLNKTHLVLYEKGTSETLTSTVLPDNSGNKSVIWASNNTDVATVSNGIVTPISAGTATITVTTVDGGKTATCTVTVLSSKLYTETSVTKDENYIFDIQVFNPPVNAILILVTYSSTGKLIEVKQVPIGSDTTSVPLMMGKSLGATYAKIMIWDNLNMLKPLSVEPEIITALP